MENLVNFCLDFAKKYKNTDPGTYKSEDGKYTIVKVEKTEPDEFSGPARVNNLTGIIEIAGGLERFSVSAILFLLTWCFLRNIYRKEDSIPISDHEIDVKTVDLLAECPEFSPKEGMLDLLTLLEQTDENIERMSKLLQNKKLLKKAFQKK
jgi:hypothetical protein